MNESVAYNWRKLKHNGIIHDCFLRDGIIRIKYQGKDRLMKIFHVDKFYEFFLTLTLVMQMIRKTALGMGICKLSIGYTIEAVNFISLSRTELLLNFVSED